MMYIYIKRSEVLGMMKKCWMAKTFMVDKLISLSTLKLSINYQSLKIQKVHLELQKRK